MCVLFHKMCYFVPQNAPKCVYRPGSACEDPLRKLTEVEIMKLYCEILCALMLTDDPVYCQRDWGQNARSLCSDASWRRYRPSPSLSDCSGYLTWKLASPIGPAC